MTDSWRLRAPLDAVMETQAAFKGAGDRQALPPDREETVKGAGEEGVGPQVSSTLSCGPVALGSVMMKGDDTTGHAE